VNKNLFLGSLLGVVTVLFYALMTYTPLYCDDFNYPFIFGTDQRISSIADLLQSQYTHYFQMNGRTIPHIFVQWFDGLIGKGLFNVINSLFFLAFFILLALVALDKKQEHKVLETTSIFLLLTILLLPGFSHVFLWMSGACNYLWTATFLLGFHLLLQEKDKPKVPSALLFLYGWMCGWTNEALVIGLFSGYVVYFLLHKEEFLLHRRILLLGMLAGLLLLVLSPGSYHRFSVNHTEGISVTSLLIQSIQAFYAMSNLRILPLLLIVLLFAKCTGKIPKNFFHDNTVWCVAVIISFVFILFTRHESSHSRFGIEVFALILLVKLLLKIGSVYSSAVSFICYAASICLLLVTAYYSNLNYKEYESCVKQINTTKTGIVETHEIECPSFFSRHILHFIPSEKSEFFPYMGDRWIEKYHDSPHLLFLPHRFLELARTDSCSYKDFDIDTDLPFYVRRMKKDEPIPQKAVLHLKEPSASDIPLYLRPIAGKLERYSARQITVPTVDVISLPQGRFFLVRKNHLVANRLEEITIE